MMKLTYNNQNERGFTLVEVMVTILIAMVILGGLFLNFIAQSSQYKFQDKRVDTTQDLEFAIRYIASDLQSALVSSTSLDTSIKHGLSGVDPHSTRWLSFAVWEETAPFDPFTNRAQRCYVFYEGMVRYDRHDKNCAVGTTIDTRSAIVGEALNGLRGKQVTHFRIFQDGVTSRAGYPTLPPALPTKEMRDAENTPYDVRGYTILIELEVDAANQGSVVDVREQTVPNGKKRIWRYMQVYPGVVVKG